MHKDGPEQNILTTPLSINLLPMKNPLFFLLALSGGMLSLSSCNSDYTAHTNGTPTTTDSAAPTSSIPTQSTSPAAQYVCPMSCQDSQSEKPGKCPTCKMELVEKA